MKWEKVKLGDVCSKIGSGATPKGGSAVYIKKGTALIRSQNVYNLSFEYDGLAFINDDAAKKLNGVTIEKNDVLLNITGDSVARSCVVPSELLPARVNQHVAIIRTDNTVLDPFFLNYYLVSPYMQSLMLGLAVGKGASRNAMTKEMIENFEIPCPLISIQKNIVKKLKAYDDLIENQQKQIALLEEAARRLYREWFVALHFPGHETTPITDGVPEGWEITKIENVCTKINAGGTPSRNQKSYWQPPTIKWYKTKELLDGWLLDSEEYISEEGLQNSSAKIFPQNTILMAIYASPTLGRLGILDSASACNQASLCLIANESIVSWQWLYYKLFELRDVFNSVAIGAGQQNISAATVKQQEIILPPKILIEKFTNISKQLFERQKILKKQITLLSEARDRLLPRLMREGGQAD